MSFPGPDRPHGSAPIFEDDGITHSEHCTCVDCAPGERPICDTPGCGREIPVGGEGHPEICPKCLSDEVAYNKANPPPRYLAPLAPEDVAAWLLARASAIGLPQASMALLSAACDIAQGAVHRSLSRGDLDAPGLRERVRAWAKEGGGG